MRLLVLGLVLGIQYAGAAGPGGTCVLDTDCTTGKCQEFRKANGLARECVGLAAAGSPCQENENCESLWCDNDNTCRDCSAVAPRVASGCFCTNIT